MSEEDRHRDKQLSIGVDFAISKKQKANRTSMTVGGLDAKNLLHVIDQRPGRWDLLEIIEEMFSLEERYCPEMWFVEDGIIWKSIIAVLNQEMMKRNCFLNITAILPINDKKTNGRSFQKRMKAGAMRFDKQGTWYAGYEAELLRFTGNSDAVLDDQFDSTAILSRGLESTAILQDEDFMDEDELYANRTDRPSSHGRSDVTGY